MSVAFTRQLGSQPGVQLNPLADNSNIQYIGNADQYFGIAMRLNQGRIDKPFIVSRGDINKKIGAGDTMRSSLLNEGYVHVVEALNNGAAGAVVQRLTTAAASISYAVARVGTGAILTPVVAGGVVTSITITNGGTNYTNGAIPVIVSGVGTGALATATVTAGVVTSVTINNGGTGYTAATAIVHDDISFTVETVAPTTPYMFSLYHLACHNNGIKISVHANEKRVSGAQTSNDVITITLTDHLDVVLNQFTGSLDPTAKDDYGNSFYLPDIVAGITDEVVLTTGTMNAVGINSSAYAYNVNGSANVINSQVLSCFSEGGTGYSTADYVNAMNKLETTTFNYSYLSSGGSKSSALILQLADLSFRTNRQFRFDIDGSLSVDAAITFIEQLNLGAKAGSELFHAYWSPLKSNDPTGINGNRFIGVATLNIAYSCGRNAVKNSKGFSAKNYPVAGKNYPVARSGIVQVYNPTDSELSRLADAKINPVLFSEFSTGGAYVFTNSITSAPVNNSLKMLISVAEMHTDLDKQITVFAKDALQLPIEIAIKKTSDFIYNLLEGAVGAKWLIPSLDPTMGGLPYRFTVAANAARPYDTIDINGWVHYDGTALQYFITQTLSK